RARFGRERWMGELDFEEPSPSLPPATRKFALALQWDACNVGVSADKSAMRISLLCGLLEAGLAACISSFCLAPISILPQERTQDPALSTPPTNQLDAATVQRIELQQRAILEAV